MDDGTTVSESESEEDFGQWPYGDGVCPSEFQFTVCFQHSYETWATPILTPMGGDTFSLSHIDGFLDLLKDVPPFVHQPPKCVYITGGGKYPLVLRSSLEVETTNDVACEQRLKAIDYFQCLGFPLPKTYNELSPSDINLTDSPDGKQYFTSIVLAWSYIISSRWVEILQCAGETSLLYHGQDIEFKDHFWDLIIHHRWLAVVKRGEKRPVHRGC
jgi:hypothetical protein